MRTMRLGLALVVVLGLILLGDARLAGATPRHQQPSPEKSAPTATPPAVQEQPIRPGLEPESCDAARAKARAAGLAGKPVLCLKRIHPTGIRPHSVGPTQVPDFPAYCDLDRYNIDRFQGCIGETLEIDLESDTGVPLGSGKLQIFQFNTLNRKSWQWTQEVNMQMYDATDLMKGTSTTITAEYYCPWCNVISQDPPADTPTVLAENQWLAGTWQLQANSANDYIAPFIEGYVINPVAANSPVSWGADQMYGIRCDQNPTFAKIAPQGCAYKYYQPTFHMKLSGNAPETAAHIQAAQQRLPGQPGVDRVGGVPLTRLTDSAKVATNRQNACGTFKRDDKNDSCDEYPFASTKEGGNGADPEHVLLNDNKSGGAQLGSFYRQNRLLDDDAFWVSIDP